MISAGASRVRACVGVPARAPVAHDLRVGADLEQRGGVLDAQATEEEALGFELGDGQRAEDAGRTRISLMLTCSGWLAA